MCVIVRELLLVEGVHSRVCEWECFLVLLRAMVVSLERLLIKYLHHHDVDRTGSKENMCVEVLETIFGKSNTRESTSILFSPANRASKITTARNNHIIMQARRITKLGMQRVIRR